MKTASIRPFESDYQTVMKKRVFQLGPWTILAGVMLALVLVLFIGVPLGKWAWKEISQPLPVLTYNPYDQVVKVTEADGTVLTVDSGDRFHKRVSEIRRGRYETDYTGRLDGRP